MDIDEFLDKEAVLIEKEPKEEIFLKKELVEYKEILEKINRCIKRNELEEAEKLYSKLWLKIKEEKFTWRQDLYDTLIEINKRLKESLNSLHRETTAKVNTIHSLIARTKKDLKEGKNEAALTAYSEIIKIYNEIPHLFLEGKKRTYINEILPLHKELRDKIEYTFFQNFNSKLSKINNLIHLTRTDLEKNNLKEAVKSYTDCLNLYNTLPDGFFLQKIELSNKILELYKEITIILEIVDLKTRLKTRLEKEVSKKVPIIEKPHKKQTLPEKPITIKKPEIPFKVEKIKKSITIKKPEKHIHPKKPEKPTHIKIQEPSIEEIKRLIPIKTITPKITKKADLKEELVKRKIDRAMFEIDKGYMEKANKDLKDALRLEPDNREAKELLEEVSKKMPPIEMASKITIPPEILTPTETQKELSPIKKIKKSITIKKPEKHIHPKKPEKPTTPKITKKADLKEELVKRKIDRALFEIDKGYMEKANKDLKDALRLEPDNREAKELLGKIK